MDMTTSFQKKQRLTAVIIQLTINDASDLFDEENREYFNSWGVTDNYNADNAICLTLGEDIEIK